MPTVRARLIVPITAPPLRDGCVEVRDGRILAVHSRPSADAIDLGDVALLPGLVNAHTHLEFSDLAEPLVPPQPFSDWLRAVVANRRGKFAGLSEEDTAQRKQAVLRRGIAECTAYGTAVIGEITTAGWGAIPDVPNGPEIFAFFECIGLTQERSEAALKAASGQFRALPLPQNVHPGFSPHAPYTVRPKLLRELAKMALVFKLPLAMHLAETPAELELLREGRGELVEFLASLGAWDPEALPRCDGVLSFLWELFGTGRFLVVHGNYLSDAEIADLKRDPQGSVVYCPRTHAYFGHAPHPWRKLQAEGIRVVLGTDSRASNPDLSVWREACFLAQRFPDVPSETLLRMLTIDGAQAFGVENDYGSLEPGKRARFALVPVGTATPDNLRGLFDSDNRGFVVNDSETC